MKRAMVRQPLSKFGIFTFVVSYKMSFIVFFLDSLFLFHTQVFESSHNENIKKTTEVLRKPGKLSLSL